MSGGHTMSKSNVSNTFTVIKKAYTEMRELERKKILGFLIDKGLNMVNTPKSGKGSSNYTNGGKLERSYDLSNWKWVEGIVDDKKFLVSLQAFDYDKSSKNVHVLMDRIGICKYDKNAKHPDYLNTMEVTSLELPLNEDDLEELYNVLTELLAD